MLSFGKVVLFSTFVASTALISVPGLTSLCYGSTLVFIRQNRAVSAEQEEMQVAAEFYGLNMKVVTVNSATDNLSVQAAVKSMETVGIAIDSGALSGINEKALLQTLQRKTGNIPLFILGISSNISPDLLGAWSGGATAKCTRLESSVYPQYVFGQIPGITWQLAGVNIPFLEKNDSYLAFDDKGISQRIESVQDNGNTFPVFIKKAIGRQTVFLACATSEGSNLASYHDVVNMFLRIAPAMMFVRYCAGERGWHPPHYYANFTIDDPWLRQPYGYVDYKGLLQEMEKHNFHTTIAFIPWNYKRSEAEVVSLFRDHPDRFSIAVHGNDHDHKEFTDYRDKSLADQVHDLKQALARMDRFQKLTGIPYDKIMIFPHSIAPEQTLEALKTYNYLATVNSSNIPQNTARPADPLEVLRPVTLSFGGFPSVSRYSTEVPVTNAYVAVNQFLGNPLFFYDHSDLFSKGIGAFDHVADEVNKLGPATEWRSLGEIVRHLYVVRLRDDANYDVLAFSSNICIENKGSRNTTYYVQKQEIGGQTIESVTVNSKIHSYTLHDNRINMAVAVPLGSASCIAIQYANEMRLDSINVAHDSIVVYLLRMGSDFRDIYLAKVGVGLTAIRFYNEHELRPTEVISCLLLALVTAIYAFWRFLLSQRRRSSSNQDCSCSLEN